MTTLPQVLPGRERRVLRYTFKERVNHWVGAVSYIYCLLTGLAFWSPWLFWLAAVMGGGQISRTLHPWIGLIFFYTTMRMHGYWSHEMHIQPRDRQWLDSIGNYIQNEDEKMPPAGKYNAGQKILFWSFFYSVILLLLTGLVLWFPEHIPWSLRWLRYICIFLHPVVALFTIANFLIHIYMSVFAEKGAMDAAVYGDVSEDFVRRYHPGWYEELTGKSPRQ